MVWKHYTLNYFIIYSLLTVCVFIYLEVRIKKENGYELIRLLLKLQINNYTGRPITFRVI